MSLTDYRGPGTALAEYASGSGPGFYYTVQPDDKSKPVYCSCPKWRFSKKLPKTCDHLEDYLARRGNPTDRDDALWERFAQLAKDIEPTYQWGNDMVGWPGSHGHYVNRKSQLGRAIIALAKDMYADGLNVGLNGGDE